MNQTALPAVSRAAHACRLAALLLIIPALNGCGVSVVGHWRMVQVVPNKEEFNIDDATFCRDGTYTATTTLEGKTTRETGTYRFNGFKLTLQPQAGGRRTYNAVRQLGKLEVLAGKRKVVLKKDG